MQRNQGRRPSDIAMGCWRSNTVSANIIIAPSISLAVLDVSLQQPKVKSHCIINTGWQTKVARRTTLLHLHALQMLGPAPVLLS